MKTNLSTKASIQGTTLLVALFLTTILAVTIAGYLKHAYQQHYIGMRSQVWNSTIAVSESGIEEALQQLNTNPTNLTANGWKNLSGATYTMTRPLSSKSSYTVTIDAANMFDPTITSVASITPPNIGFGNAGSVMAAIGLDVNADSKDSFVSRAIQVKCSKDSLFVKGMVAKYTITMNGDGIETDSFDSTQPAFSTDGMYPKDDLSKRRSNGDIASNYTIESTVSGGNAKIYGHASVGPGGTVEVGPNGGVGDFAWVSSNPGTMQPGYFSDDMNYTFWSFPWPGTSGSTPAGPGTVTTTNYTITGVAGGIITTNVYPSVIPIGGVTTNAAYATVNTLPSPVPYGTTTNQTTKNDKSKTYPVTGTYVGVPTYNENSGQYSYEKIIKTTYTYPNFTYTYSTYLYNTNFTITSADYDYILFGSTAGMPPQVFYMPEITKGKFYVAGNAVLKVGGNISMAGQDGIWLGTDGKLKMIVNGTSIAMNGLGVFNPTGYAQNFSLYCTDSVTDLKLSGNGEFIGSIYAPNADVTLNGGGSEVEDFIGALVARSIVLNGHYKFHYDEALRGLKDEGRYIVRQWDEVPIAKLN